MLGSTFQAGLCFGTLMILSCLQGCTGSSPAPAPPPLPTPGGYSAANRSDPEVIAAAEFAVADQSKLGPVLKLVSIQSASTQVVAGRNTQLYLIVDDAGVKKPAEVIVYTDLKPGSFGKRLGLAMTAVSVNWDEPLLTMAISCPGWNRLT